MLDVMYYSCLHLQAACSDCGLGLSDVALPWDLKLACTLPNCKMPRMTVQDKLDLLNTYNACKSISKTAAQCGVCRATARHCISRWNKEHTLDNKPSTGRKPILSDTAASHASDLLDEGQQGGARQVAKQLVAEGLASKLVHKSTVIRAARKAAAREGCKMVVSKQRPPKELTRATKLKRLQFAQRNNKTSWGQVMFTDRKRFYLRYPGSCVQPCRWHKIGPNRPTRHGFYQPNKPLCHNVYGGITKFGVTKLCEVAGSSKYKSTFKNKKGEQARNICTAQYKHVLVTTLLPGGQRLFGGAGFSSWTLQQDNDPAHLDAVGVVREWGEKNKSHVRVLPNWPPNSPDLNPIENVWGFVQAKVDALGCKSLEEFKNAVHEQWNAIPSSMLSNLFTSMKGRLASVVAEKGGKTKY